VTFFVAAALCTLSWTADTVDTRPLFYELHGKPQWYDVAARPWPGLRDTLFGTFVDPTPTIPAGRYRIVKTISTRIPWSLYVIVGTADGPDTLRAGASNFVLWNWQAYRPMPEGWPLR